MLDHFVHRSLPDEILKLLEFCLQGFLSEQELVCFLLNQFHPLLVLVEVPVGVNNLVESEGTVVFDDLQLLGVKEDSLLREEEGGGQLADPGFVQALLRQPSFSLRWAPIEALCIVLEALHGVSEGRIPSCVDVFTAHVQYDGAHRLSRLSYFSCFALLVSNFDCADNLAQKHSLDGLLEL